MIYLKHKGGDVLTIRSFEEDHAKNLLQNFTTWEKPTAKEIKAFEKNKNAANDRSDQGDSKESNAE